jgi:hypothetical protein
MARKSLDDILEGNDEPESPITEAQAEVVEQPEGQPRDDGGKFASKGVEPQQGTPEAEAVPPTADKLPQEEYKALREEREKRQQLEAQLETLRRESQQRPQEPQPPVSLWDNEEAWGGQLVSQAVQQASYQSRLQMSEMLMAQEVQDFSAVRNQLFEFVGANPAINQQVAESQHPWKTAYTLFKNQQTMQELGATDIETLRAKIREEVLAEAQAQAPAAKIPPSLSNQRSVASRSGPAWSGPTPLGDLIGN